MSLIILLLQPNFRAKSRTYCEYESENEFLEGVCKIYEDHLRRKYPKAPKITYAVTQLFDFMDTLRDISCMVYQESTKTYAPNSKDWIKDKVYVLLRKEALKSNAVIEI